jgi:hypothetical protein
MYSSSSTSYPCAQRSGQYDHAPVGIFGQFDRVSAGVPVVVTNRVVSNLDVATVSRSVIEVNMYVCF